MNRKVLGIIFILLLVAVSWFKPAFCDSMSKDELIQQYMNSEDQYKKAASNANKYSSPDIYGQTDNGNSSVKAIHENIGISKIDSLSVTPETDALIEKSEKLTPFGYDLFNAPSELTQPSEVADAADYVLGPGDNIIIYLWGKVEKEYNLTIDRQGKVFIPKIGETTAWGQTLSGFSERVKNSLSRVYTDFKISVSLGKIRSIRIYLTGEVKKPGAYTVSSLTTLFNALYMAGGPNLSGSIRNIRLIRNNSIEQTVDLYEFLLKGDTKSDVRLESGDAIFIPISGPRVAVKGQIKRPALYELASGETATQLLELAGGPTAEAYLDRIMLDRISPDDERVVIDLNLNASVTEKIDDIELADGDKLKIFSVYEMKRNIVSVAGMVKHPGQFERTDTTTLRTLIDMGELLPDNVYYERANLFRNYTDLRVEIIPVDIKKVLLGEFNIPLWDLDSLHIYSINEIEWKKHVYINGEVKKPGQYQYYENMTVYDLIFLAGNLKRNAYLTHVELAQTDSAGNMHSRIIDLTDETMRQTKLWEDNRVFVREIPNWFLHRLVTIEGEVRFPGQYALLSRNESLYDLIKRAGGFTLQAFPKGLVLNRRSIGDDLIRQNLPDIISNSEPLWEDSTGEVRKLQVFNFNPENMNRMIVDLDRIRRTNGQEGDMVLQRDDYIYIPEIPTGISVMGAVSANGTIKYEPDQQVKHYITRAGNFTRQANKSGTKLIRADGHVLSGKSVLKKKVEMGDVVYVPTEIKKRRDWLKIMSTTVSIIGGVVTSAFIIDRL